MREYTAVYRVTVTDASDGPEVVVQASGLPAIGDTYSAGNDSDTSVECVSLKPKLAGDSPLRWRVVCQFQTKGTGGGLPPIRTLDSGGDHSDDPTKWVPEYSISHMQVSSPCRDAIFRGDAAITSSATGEVLREVDSAGPIVNAAMVPFSPAPERLESIMVFRCRTHLDDYPATINANYQNTINTEDLWVHIFGNGGKRELFVWKYQCFFMPIGGTLIRYNDQWVWALDIELHLDMRGMMGWRKRLSNQGYRHQAAVGDDDGFGGTYTEADISPGNVGTAAIRGPDKREISEPHLLTMDGQPLPTGGTPTYLTYSVLDEMPHQQILFDLGVNREDWS